MIRAKYTCYKSFVFILTIGILLCIALITHRYHNPSSIDIQYLDDLCNQQKFNTGGILQWNRQRNKVRKETDHTQYVLRDDKNKTLTKGDTVIDDRVWDGKSVKGVIYMFIQTMNLKGISSTIRGLEGQFNNQAGYPYVLLSAGLITPDFKAGIRKLLKDPQQVYFGQIDLNAWDYPHWISSERAEYAFQRLRKLKVPNEGSAFTHQKHRYQSGLFIHHPLFDDVEYIWQIEVSSKFPCNLARHDPFVEMKTKKQKFGFILSQKEVEISVHSLWPASMYFMSNSKRWIQPAQKSLLSSILGLDQQFNLCQMSSTFHIIDTSFLRSEPYQNYFHYLDLVGGFFYEGWTQASVRTVAAAMFLEDNELAFLENVGFISSEGQHCPVETDACTCNSRHSQKITTESCTFQFLKAMSVKYALKMLDRPSSLQKSHKEIARAPAKDSNFRSSHSSSMNQRASILKKQASIMSESLHCDDAEDDTCDINQGPDTSSLQKSQKEIAEDSDFHDQSSMDRTKYIPTQQAIVMSESLHNNDSEEDAFDMDVVDMDAVDMEAPDMDEYDMDEFIDDMDAHVDDMF